MERVLQGPGAGHRVLVRNLICRAGRRSSTAIFGFQDRFRALPGDYRDSHEPTSAAALPRRQRQRSHRGRRRGQGIHSGVDAPDRGGLSERRLRGHQQHHRPGPDNSPTNIFGAYLQVIYDENWGHSGNTTMRHNIKTGNQIPVELLAEIDRKTDDGRPSKGRFQFSPYSGVAAPLASCGDIANAGKSRWPSRATAVVQASSKPLTPNLGPATARPALTLNRARAARPAPTSNQRRAKENRHSQASRALRSVKASAAGLIPRSLCVFATCQRSAHLESELSLHELDLR